MGKFHLRITGDIGFEFWQDIPEYEGLYQGSTYGRIKNKKTGRILKQIKTKDGYLCVHFPSDKKILVHRIIASTFIPKWSPEYTQVNHKSEVKTENQVWNLEWCSRIYNMNYGKWETLRSEINKRSKSKPVSQYSLNNEFIATYPSVKEAERQTSINASKISYCCNGKYKQTHNYIWKYV